MVNDKNLQGQYSQITYFIQAKKKTHWIILHTEFQSPSAYPSGRKVKSWRERKKKKINGENNGNLLYVDTSGARANFANPEPSVQPKSLEIFIEVSPPLFHFQDCLIHWTTRLCIYI